MIDFSKLNKRKDHKPQPIRLSQRDIINHLYYSEYTQMDVSSFDPNHYLDSTTSSAATRRPPLPAGRSFPAVLGEPKSRPWKSKDDSTKQGIAIDVPVEFDMASLPPDVQALFKDGDGNLSTTKVVIIDGIMIDLREGPSGSPPMIDWSPGKNNKGRKYREACGLNVEGQPFNFRMLQGRTVLAKIKHEPYEGDIFDKIDSVAKL